MIFNESYQELLQKFKNQGYNFIHFDEFNIIEERPTTHLLKDGGQAIKMNKGDPYWCTECFIYLIVRMVDDTRLWVTAIAESLSNSL